MNKDIVFTVALVGAAFSGTCGCWVAKNTQVLGMPTPLDPDQLLDALPRSWLGYLSSSGPTHIHETGDRHAR